MADPLSKIRLVAAMLCIVGSLFVAVNAAEAYKSAEDVSVEEVIETAELKKLKTIAESLRKSTVRRRAGFHPEGNYQLNPQRNLAQLRMNCQSFAPSCERHNHNGLGTYLLV